MARHALKRFLSPLIFFFMLFVILSQSILAQNLPSDVKVLCPNCTLTDSTLTITTVFGKPGEGGTGHQTDASLPLLLPQLLKLIDSFPSVSLDSAHITRAIDENKITPLINSTVYSSDYGTGLFWRIPITAGPGHPMIIQADQYRPGYDFKNDVPIPIFERYSGFIVNITVVNTGRDLIMTIVFNGDVIYQGPPLENFQVGGISLLSAAQDNAKDRYGQWKVDTAIDGVLKDSSIWNVKKFVASPVAIQKVDQAGKLSDSTTFSPESGEELRFTPSFLLHPDDGKINPQWEGDIFDVNGGPIFAQIATGKPFLAWDGTVGIAGPGGGRRFADAGEYSYQIFAFTPEATFLYARGRVEVTGGAVVRIIPSSASLRPAGLTPPQQPTSVVFTVTTTDSQGQAMSNRQLNFTVSVPLRRDTNLLQRGGHDHSSDRPLGVFQELDSRGKEIGRPVTAIGDDAYEFQNSTDNSGNLWLRYTSPVAGGTVTIKAVPARGSLGSGSSNTANVDVAVLNLALLPANPDLYSKTGGTTRHPGPPLMGRPDENHWILSGIIPDFQAAAMAYLNATGTRLLVNDMSLPKGGIFDLDGNWQPDHNAHRLGRSVDIENSRSDALFRAFKGNHWRFVEEDPDRFPHFESTR